MATKNNRSVKENQPEADQPLAEKKKILWISVSIIGSIIFLAWLYGFFYVLKSNNQEKRFTETKPNQIIEVKNQLNNIKEEFKNNLKEKEDEQRADIILSEEEKKIMQEMRKKLEQKSLLQATTTPKQ